MVRLFHNQSKIQSIDEDIKEKKSVVEEVEKKMFDATELSNELEGEMRDASQALDDIEEQILDMVNRRSIVMILNIQYLYSLSL